MAWITNHRVLVEKTLSRVLSWHPVWDCGSMVFRREKELEDYLVKNWNLFFYFDYWCRQYRLNKKYHIDLLGNDIRGNRVFVIELKTEEYKSSHLKQLDNYIVLLKKKTWLRNHDVVGLLVNYYSNKLHATFLRKP